MINSIRKKNMILYNLNIASISVQFKITTVKLQLFELPTIRIANYRDHITGEKCEFEYEITSVIKICRQYGSANVRV